MKPPDRLEMRDLLRDAAVNTRSRLGRTIGLGFAIALGVATFTAVLSISQAGARQVEARFDALRPSHITVRPFGQSTEAFELFENDTVDKIARLDGVVASVVVDVHPGVLLDMPWISDGGIQTQVLGVGGDLVRAVDAHLEGTSFGKQDDLMSARVAIVGENVARRLGLADAGRRPTIWLDGVPFSTVAVLRSTSQLDEALDSIIVPRSTGIRLFGSDVDGAKTVVKVRKGRAEPVGGAIPLSLSPERPERWYVDIPRIPPELGEGVGGDVRTLALSVAGLAMLMGIVTIGNATSRSLFERTPEIGLRRALGARALDVVRLLLVESIQVALVGAMLGLALGSAGAVIVAFRNGWPVTITWWAVGLSIPAAVVAGILGGAVPAWRSTRISPSEALRRE